MPREETDQWAWGLRKAGAPHMKCSLTSRTFTKAARSVKVRAGNTCAHPGKEKMRKSVFAIALRKGEIVTIMVIS